MKEQNPQRHPKKTRRKTKKLREIFVLLRG